MKKKLIFSDSIIKINHQDLKTPIVDRHIEEYKRDYHFNINFDKYENITPIETKAIFIKGDKNTSVLTANLFIKSIPINITGYTITANIKESDGSTITTIPCEIYDSVNGIIKIKLVSNIIDIAGENEFEIVLQKENNILISQKYKYTVLDSLGEGAAGGETQLTALQSLIQQVQESKIEVDNIVQELEVTSSDIEDIIGMVGGL